MVDPLPSGLKLLLIGNSSVGKSTQTSKREDPAAALEFSSAYLMLGKSSLLLRFTDDEFLSEEETAATIGVDFKVKSIEVDGRRYKLSIWVCRLPTGSFI